MFSVFTGASPALQSVLEEARTYIGATYAESTQATYRSQLRQYLRFCTYFNFKPVPADNITLKCYITVLARSLKCSSIPGYLNIIRLLHVESGFPNPLENNFEINCLKKGVQRLKGSPPEPKLPISPEILCRIKSILCFYQSDDVAFWAACLIAFFGFLRKSTLLPKSKSDKSSHSLEIRDVNYNLDGTFTVTVRHSKTIQFGQRVLKLPYVKAKNGEPLCPVRAMYQMRFNQPKECNLPLFSYENRGNIEFFTHSSFVTKLRNCLTKLGYDPTKYSGHSFRKGGCTHGFQLGLSPVVLRQRGDWKSDCIFRYINLSNEQLHEAASVLIRGEHSSAR